MLSRRDGQAFFKVPQNGNYFFVFRGEDDIRKTLFRLTSVKSAEIESQIRIVKHGAVFGVHRVAQGFHGCSIIVISFCDPDIALRLGGVSKNRGDPFIAILGRDGKQEVDGKLRRGSPVFETPLDLSAT